MNLRNLILAVFIILILGCTRTSEPSQKIFIGGNEGLSIKFLQNEPPLSVLDNSQEDFRITLELDNRGESSISKGRIIATLQGIQKEAFSLLSLNVVSNNELEGSLKIGDQKVPGAITELSFGRANYKNDLSADFEIDLVANVCYQYQTTALSNDFCLKQKASLVSDTQACNVDHTLVVENSGAPVKVTKIDEKPSGQSQIRIIFDIEKIGTGTIFAPDTFTTTCGENDQKEDDIKVTVSSTGLNLKIECPGLEGGKSSGIIRLTNGQSRTVICKIDTTNIQQEAFITPLEIKLDYFYKDSISIPFIVENSDF